MRREYEVHHPGGRHRTATLKGARQFARRLAGTRLYGRFRPDDSLDNDDLNGFRPLEGWNLGGDEGCNTVVICVRP